MKALILIIVAALLIGCSENETGRPCKVWRVPPDKAALVVAFVDSALATIKVTQRTENEDWDDFCNAAYHNATQLYGYWADGEKFKSGEWYDCACEQDRATNAQQGEGRWLK